MEEKKYSIIGKVEIGTDEYRELIESSMEQKERADAYMREGWKKDEEIKKLKMQVESLENKVKKCEKFFKNNNAPSDIVSVLMSILEEE